MNSTTRYIICEITDKTFDPSYNSSSIKNYRVRKAARGILVNDNKIALLNVSKKNYHKLPGGGIENDETNEQGFKREVIEEVGVGCNILDENPVVIEYRDKEKLLQISYVFLAEVKGKIGQPNFEQSEIDEGFQLEWVPINDVEKIMSEDKPTDWEGEFISLRDKEIFKFYKQKLLKK